MATKRKNPSKSKEPGNPSGPRPKPRSNDELIAAAQPYNSPAKFRKHAFPTYKSALRRGILAQCHAHMTDGNIKWTPKALKEAASHYTTRSEFKTKNARAYYAAHRLGILDECCHHMSYVYTQWTDQMIQDEAIKYGSSSEFRAGHEPAWQAARERGFENFSGHMTSKYRYWSTELLLAEAEKYPTLTEFARGSSSAYQIACDKGIDQFSGHMEQKRFKRTDEELRAEAAKHNTVTDFLTADENAYHAAARRGKDFRDDICSHMVPAPGASDNDVIYVWSMEHQGQVIHKVGKTSARRGQSRIRECAGFHKVKVTVLRYKSVLRADILERHILQIGTQAGVRGDGASEMRIFTDAELTVVLQMIDDALAS